MRVRVDLSRCYPRNLATLELSPHQTVPWNKISPWWDFEEIRYIIAYNVIQVHSCGYSRHALIACTTLWHCYSSTSCYCAYLRLAAASTVRRGFCTRVPHWACPWIILQLVPTEADNVVTSYDYFYLLFLGVYWSFVGYSAPTLPSCQCAKVYWWWNLFVVWWSRC